VMCRHAARPTAGQAVYTTIVAGQACPGSEPLKELGKALLSLMFGPS